MLVLHQQHHNNCRYYLPLEPLLGIGAAKYQQHAIGFKDLGIQLWEAHKYNNGI
jgi:hypothetical protein